MGNDKRSLAFAPCEEKHVMSFKVPENFADTNKVSFRICSKGFVDGLVEVNHLDGEMTHNFEGRYDKENNLIVFPINVE